MTRAPPHLPRCSTYAVLVSSLGTTDTVNTTIGVRNAVFTSNNGFILNGVPIQIKGVSQHQDFAGTGTAVPRRVNEYRVSRAPTAGLSRGGGLA